MDYQGRGVHPVTMLRINGAGKNAPQFFLARLSVILMLLFAMGCEESEKWVEDPSGYLETADFPGYFRRIPLFGVNGHNGLKPAEKETHCSVYGIYVGGASGALVRTFNDSVLFHIPLKENLPYSSEVTAVQVNGKAVQNGYPALSEIEVVLADEFAAIYQKVARGYPKLIDKIAGEVHDPRSKLDLGSIETFHCAASEGKLLIFGRTYDLMYEFDLAFLFEQGHDLYELKRIFAHEFFKGE